MSKAQIKDVAFLITKGTTPTTMGEKFVSNGVNFIKAESLSFSKHINQSVFEHIDKDTDEKLKRSRLEKDDLLFSIAGYLGKMGIVREIDLPANTNQAVAIIRLDKSKIDIDYLYYYLAQNHIQGYINRLSAQSVQPNLNLELLGKLEFENRKIEEQQKIAAVLSALDAKIELNQRINAELESMAKTLYDYWFVQFDFPNEKGKPYKSAGGGMVWSEELKREIPLGWEVGELGDILSLEYGKPLKEEDRSGSGYPVLGSNGIVGYHKEYLVEGYGIVVGRKGTAGAVVWVEDNFYPIDTAFYVKDKLGTNNLFFHYLLLLRSSIKQGESSSAVPGLNRNFAHSIKVAIPEKSIIQDFNKIVEPFFSKIKTCNKESQTLTELRDWLLPMLMNGQITVS
ncbi:restriction endonuclease subunit S [Chloroflexota bacterium]